MAKIDKKQKRIQKLKNRNSKIIKKLTNKQNKIISNLSNCTVTKKSFDEDGNLIETTENISEDEIKQAMLDGVVFEEVDYDNMIEIINSDGHILNLITPQVIDLMDENLATITEKLASRFLDKGSVMYICSNCGKQFGIPLFATKKGNANIKKGIAPFPCKNGNVK